MGTDEVTAAGGVRDAELDRETSVTVSGDPSPRGPESSAEAARTLLAEPGV